MNNEMKYKLHSWGIHQQMYDIDMNDIKVQCSIWVSGDEKHNNNLVRHAVDKKYIYI